MPDSSSASTQAVNGNSALRQYEEAKIRVPKNQLDKDAFLTILLAQLTHQNPMEPMDDNQFISQMAQFSTLEQLTQMNTAITNSQAYDMIGKFIIADVAQENKPSKEVMGIVESVVVSNGVAYMIINGDQKVKYSEVIAVLDDGSNAYAQLTTEMLAGSSLIGKYCTAEVTKRDADGNVMKDADGNPITEKIEGIVEELKIMNGVVIAVINGRDVPIGQITKISTKEPAPAPTDPEPGADEQVDPPETGNIEG